MTSIRVSLQRLQTDTTDTATRRQILQIDQQAGYYRQTDTTDGYTG